MGAMTLWDQGSNVCQCNAKGRLMMLSIGGGMMVHDGTRLSGGGMMVHDGTRWYTTIHLGPYLYYYCKCLT